MNDLMQSQPVAAQPQHALPEEVLMQGLKGQRRSYLHKLAIEKKLISIDAPTPTKGTLLMIIEAGVPLTTEQIKVADDIDPSVPLNEAHVNPELRQTKPVDPIKKAIEEVPADPEYDPLAMPEEEVTPAEAVLAQFANETNVMALKKMFSIAFPEEPQFAMKTNRAEILAKVTELLT